MKINPNANNTPINPRNNISAGNLNRNNRSTAFQGAQISGADAREGVDFTLTISDRAHKLLRSMGFDSMCELSEAKGWHDLVKIDEMREIGVEYFSFEFDTLSSTQHNIFNRLPIEIDISVRMEMAAKLSDAIDAYRNMPDATSEQRAMSREAASQMANHIAENYLGGHASEASVRFLETIEFFVNFDTQREQGYLVHRGEGNMPHMVAGCNIIPDFMFWVREHLSSDESRAWWERANRSIDFNNPADWADVREARYKLITKYGPLQAEMERTGELEAWIQRQNREFAENAERINSTVSDVRANFETLLQETEFSSVANWINSMLELLERLSPPQTSTE